MPALAQLDSRIANPGGPMVPYFVRLRCRRRAGHDGLHVGGSIHRVWRQVSQPPVAQGAKWPKPCGFLDPLSHVVCAIDRSSPGSEPLLGHGMTICAVLTNTFLDAATS
jgi:hypothetical protein